MVGDCLTTKQHCREKEFSLSSQMLCSTAWSLQTVVWTISPFLLTHPCRSLCFLFHARCSHAFLPFSTNCTHALHHWSSPSYMWMPVIKVILYCLLNGIFGGQVPLGLVIWHSNATVLCTAYTCLTSGSPRCLMAHLLGEAGQLVIGLFSVSAPERKSPITTDRDFWRSWFTV